MIFPGQRQWEENNAYVWAQSLNMKTSESQYGHHYNKKKIEAGTRCDNVFFTPYCPAACFYTVHRGPSRGFITI